MKRLFDVVCNNGECPSNGDITEVFKHTDDVVICQSCGEPMVIAYRKTPSVYLKGGKEAGFYGDGFVNTGKQKGDRRG